MRIDFGVMRAGFGGNHAAWEVRPGISADAAGVLGQRTIGAAARIGERSVPPNPVQGGPATPHGDRGVAKTAAPHHQADTHDRTVDHAEDLTPHDMQCLDYPRRTGHTATPGQHPDDRYQQQLARRTAPKEVTLRMINNRHTFRKVHRDGGPLCRAWVGYRVRPECAS